MAQSKALTKKLTLKEYAEKINSSWRDSVKSIIQTGKLLIEAKANLKKADWVELSEDLVDFSKGTVSKLVTIASDPRLTKVSHVKLLPPSWGTMYQLTLLDDKTFKEALDTGKIHSGMERSEVEELLGKAKSKIDKAKASDADVVDDDDDDDDEGEGEEEREPPRKRSEPEPVKPTRNKPAPAPKTSIEVAFENFENGLDSLAEFGEKLEEVIEASERNGTVDIDNELLDKIKNLGAWLTRFAKDHR